MGRVKQCIRSLRSRLHSRVCLRARLRSRLSTSSSLLARSDRGCSPDATLSTKTARLSTTTSGTIDKNPILRVVNGLASPTLNREQGTTGYHRAESFATSHPLRSTSLASLSTSSSASFVCRGARRVEREHVEGRGIERPSSAGWDARSEDEILKQKARKEIHGYLNDRGVRVVAPVYAQPQSDSFDLPPRLSANSFDGSTHTISLTSSETHVPIINEDDFDALPDWSDVEDDPAYNGTPVERASSLTSSESYDDAAKELDMASLATRMASEYPEGGTAPGGGAARPRRRLS